MEGVTAADAPESLPGAHDRPVLADRTDEVVAAGWLKATLPTEDGAEENLVQANAEDQHGRQQCLDSLLQFDKSLPEHREIPCGMINVCCIIPIVIITGRSTRIERF